MGSTIGIQHEVDGTDFTDHRNRWDRFRRLHGTVEGSSGDDCFTVCHDTDANDGDLLIKHYANVNSGPSSWTETESKVALTDKIAGPWALSVAQDGAGNLIIGYTSADDEVKVAFLTRTGGSYAKTWEEVAITLSAGQTAGLVDVDVSNQPTEQLSVVVAVLVKQSPEVAKVVLASRDKLGSAWTASPVEITINSQNNSINGTQDANPYGGPLAIAASNNFWTGGDFAQQTHVYVLARGADYGRMELWDVEWDRDDADNWNDPVQVHSNFCPAALNVKDAYGSLFTSEEPAISSASDFRVMVAAATRQTLYLGEYDGGFDDGTSSEEGFWVVGRSARTLLLPYDWPTQVGTETYTARTGGGTDDIRLIALVGGPDRVCFQVVREVKYGGQTGYKWTPLMFVHGRIVTGTDDAKSIVWHHNSGYTEYDSYVHKTSNVFDGVNRAFEDGRMSAFFFRLGWVFGSTYLSRSFATTIQPTNSGAPVSPENGATVDTDAITLRSPVLYNTKQGLDLYAGFKLESVDVPGEGISGMESDYADASYSAEHTYDMVAEPGESGYFTDGVMRQGEWYVRYREIDTHGLVADWNTGILAGTDFNSFDVDHPPETINHSPTNLEVRDFDGTGDVVLSWGFSDTSPYDYQSAYEIEVERKTGAVNLVTVAKTTSTDRQHTVTIGAGEKSNILRWRVKVYDRDDVAGAWSDWHEFYCSDAPTVEITYPTTVSSTPKPTITWTYTAGSHGAQTKYRVEVKTRWGGTLHDSGVLSGAATSYALPEPVLWLGGKFLVIVRVWDTLDSYAEDRRNKIDTDWPYTATPSDIVIDQSTYDTSGYVKISWTNTSKDANFIRYTVYRRLATETEWTEVGSSVVGSGTENVLDVLAPANQPLHYYVAQYRDLDGLEVPSDPADYEEVTLVGTNYFFLDASTQGMTQAQFFTAAVQGEVVSVALYHVTEESFGEEYEEEIINIIGKGRKKEIGTRYGYIGSITAQLRGLGSLSSRGERLQIELARSLREEMWLRNPFGDVVLCSIGQPEFTREPGVGTEEYTQVTIPYVEVTNASG